MNRIEEQRSDARMWIDEEGMHVIGRGGQQSTEELQSMTEEYQKQVKKSPIWDKMIKEFGEEQALEMLKEFQFKTQ